MKLPCGCCEGTGVLTPLLVANRPGLNSLIYRVGTHATFLETMKARLSSSDYPELARIKTRDSTDISIALLDAWATLADVLTFYQERIANEGYLRTATERRSISELARLVGYSLRPGISSSVYLAYNMEKGSTEIPVAQRAQSVPGPGERLQSFETSERLLASSQWNAIKPRMTQPTKLALETNADKIDSIYLQGTSTQLKPNDPLLFVFGEGPGQQVLRRVKEIKPQKAEGRTMVILQRPRDIETSIKIIRRVTDRYLDMKSFCNSNNPRVKTNIEDILMDFRKQLCQKNIEEIYLSSKLKALQTSLEDAVLNSADNLKRWVSEFISQLGKILVTRSFSADSPQNNDLQGTQQEDISRLIDLIGPLSIQPLPQPANSLLLARDAKQIFHAKSDGVPQLLTALKPCIAKDIYIAWANYEARGTSNVGVYALRLTASLFGANAPPVMNIKLVSDKTFQISPDGDPAVDENEKPNTIYLDNSYEKILPDSWIVVDTKNIGMTCLKSLVSRARNLQAKGSRSAYGISGSTTCIKLDSCWFEKEKTSENAFKSIRTTVVYAQSEELKLAQEPITKPISGKDIELDSLYPGLESGRWIIVSGERNISNTSGVKKSELVMLAKVIQSSDEDQSGDKGTSGVHSTLILDKGLAYSYKRETVTIYANVVKATHGETKREVLGSGNASAAFQQFALSQAPLTYLSAATPQGAKSTLQVRVNGILWHEAESLFDLGPKDRGYVIKTDDASKTTIIFGNGEHGSRLHTGMENVTAVYRASIGRPGNVKEGQIRLLATKPPGVKTVVNPLCSSGGADSEGPDQARKNAPLATLALDRLVSVEDYASFARTYAGIEKASAICLSNGQRQLVHLTIAGCDDIPIDETSDLLRNLNLAVHQFGDPFQPVQVAIRELMLLVISANVRILPDYQWEKVEPQIRSVLLDAFGFDRRELGQSAFLSEVVSVIQQVEGVDYVDMVVFDSVSENVKPEELAKLSSSLSLKPAIEVQLAGPNKKLEKPDQDKRILPAQLAYLSPDMRDTLILNPLEVSV